MTPIFTLFIFIQFAFSRKPKPHTQETCISIGEQCSSKYPREYRCCDSARGGTTACEWYPGYSYLDSHDIKKGRCCVKPNKSGCSKDKDCCGENGNCTDGICMKTKGKTISAADTNHLLEDDGEKFINIAENVDHDKDNKIFGLARISQIIGLIIVIVFVGCNV
eukprot:772827_1